MLRIFITYHHEKASSNAKKICDFLDERFPYAKVFLDKRDLEGGDVWEPLVAKALFTANVYICLIDGDWAWRLWHPSSWVRRELEVAILNPNKKRLFPLIMDGAKDPNHSGLPSTITKLLENQCKVFKPSNRGLTQLATWIEHFWKEAAADNSLPILFISSEIAASSDESLEYFSLVATELARELQLDNKKNLPIDFVLKVPRPQSPEASQISMLRELEDTTDKYLAVILSPYNTESLAPHVLRLRKANPRLPMFTIDKCFPDNCKAFKKFPHLLPAGVMNHWRKGGEIAAQSFYRHCQRMGFKSPTVILVEGLEGSKERLDGFEAQIKHLTHDAVQIRRLRGCEFRRDKAREITNQFLASKRPGDIHGFFCANDEMALGVWDSVRKWEEGHKTRSGVRIVGYDGIRDLTVLMSQDDHLILSTIDVRLRDQVKQLASLVFETLLTPTGPQFSRRVEQILGSEFPNSDKQLCKTKADLNTLPPAILKKLRSPS